MTQNATTPTPAQNSKLLALVGELRRYRPEADEATLASLALALERKLPTLRFGSSNEIAADHDTGHARDRMAVGRSVAQIVEESRFESRIFEAFVARSEVARQKLVLLVDDAADVLVTLGAFLEGAGFEVLKASGADAALRIIATTPGIDALVTDVAMPGMSGVDLILQALELRPNLPSVIVTAFADAKTLAALPASTKILRKPFRRVDLIECVKGLLHVAVERVN